MEIHLCMLLHAPVSLFSVVPRETFASACCWWSSSCRRFCSSAKTKHALGCGKINTIKWFRQPSNIAARNVGVGTKKNNPVAVITSRPYQQIEFNRNYGISIEIELNHYSQLGQMLQLCSAGTPASYTNFRIEDDSHMLWTAFNVLHCIFFFGPIVIMLRRWSVPRMCHNCDSKKKFQC